MMADHIRLPVYGNMQMRHEPTADGFKTTVTLQQVGERLVPIDASWKIINDWLAHHAQAQTRR